MSRQQGGILLTMDLDHLQQVGALRALNLTPCTKSDGGFFQAGRPGSHWKARQCWLMAYVVAVLSFISVAQYCRQCFFDIVANLRAR